ncbi:MAG: hypothetical protein LLG06_03440 [Desulfobacteraceae bacterium]|nr:hypothetical protein [Desulfobacteraceae bacterium]
MDRFERLEKQIEELRGHMAALAKAFESIPPLVAQNRHPVESLLHQYGFPVIDHNGKTQLLFPSDIPEKALDLFYLLMRRYSFRLFLRDLIRLPQADRPDALTRYCSLRTVKSYLATLESLGMVSCDGMRYSLLKRVPSFGPTLEWFVCEIFRREFLSPALFNVRLRNTRYGGDYDVISTIAGKLVYVEVKSSPPRGVELQAVNAFLERLEDLRPHLAVLLVDTELRMRDKLVPLLAEGLARGGGRGPARTVVRLAGEIFHVDHSIYVTNSRKGIYTNLRTCCRDFLLRQRAGPCPPSRSEPEGEAGPSKSETQ